MLNIDYRLTEKEFLKLGVKNFREIYSQKKQQKLFDDFETGRVSASLFRRELKKIIPKKISDKTFDRAWNAMLKDFPEERMRLLFQLRKKYRLFLLSNTNEIHIHAFSVYLEKKFGMKNLRHIFEKEYFSFQTGMRKPERRLFEFVIRKNKLKKSETLFIDDTYENIQGAKKTGMKAFWLKKRKTVLDLFPGEIR